MANVLIIDDDKSILELFRFVFTEAGHEARTAADGAEALERVSESVPDFMVVDIAMPGMNGRQFIARLAQMAADDGRFADIPFVVMTGENFMDADIDKDFAAAPGFIRFFPKMIPPEDVLASMEEVLGGGDGLTQARKRILAADDDPGIRALYATLFSEAGYAVETVPDAGAALDKYLSGRYDLLVLDVLMPAGGGQKVFDIARRLLEEDVPVIFVTGFPERLKEAVLSRPRTAIFNKPVDEAALLAEVRRCIGEARR